MGLIMILCRFFFFIGEPILLGGVLFGLLLNGALFLGLVRGFIGLVLFIVYVGGTMVLFTYCLILSPLQFFSKIKKYYRVVLLLGGFFLVFGGVISIYEFYYFFGLLLMVGVLLFIVILRVVELIDFSRGTLRVEYDFLSWFVVYLFHLDCLIHLVCGRVGWLI